MSSYMSSQPKPCVVRLTADSSLKAGSLRNFRGPDHAIQIADFFVNQADNKRVHAGLMFTVAIQAESMHEAIAKALILCSSVVDEIALAHGTSIADPCVRVAVGMESEGGTVELAQVLPNIPEIRKYRREFNDQLYRPLFEQLHKGANTREDQKFAARLRRGFRYLRRSMLEQDPIDRFEDLSNALQSLEPLLRRKFSTSTTFTRACATCRESLICAACQTAILAQDNFSGADYIATKVLGFSDKEARRLRDRRNDIVHSTKELEELLSDLPGVTDLARAVFLRAVAELLDGAPELRSQLPRRSLPIVGSPVATVVATLHGTSLAELHASTRLPTLRLAHIESVLPNREIDDTEPEVCIAIKLCIAIEDFSGEWELTEAKVDFERDPEDSGPDPQILLQKWLT